MRFALFSLLACGALAQNCSNLNAANCLAWQSMYDLVLGTNPAQITADDACAGNPRENACATSGSNHCGINPITNTQTQNDLLIIQCGPGLLSQHIEQFNIDVATPITLPSSIPFPDTQQINIVGNPYTMNLQMQYFNGWSNLASIGEVMANNVDFTGAQSPPQLTTIDITTQNIVGVIPDSYKIQGCRIYQLPDTATNLCSAQALHAHAELSALHAHAGGDAEHEHPPSRGTPASTWAALGLGLAALLAV